jgi:DTW domain-containing protein YfiP
MVSRSTQPRCQRCLQRGAPCLCAEILPVRAHLEVVILRHALEAQKQTGSARWAAQALGCQIIDYAAEAAPFDESLLDAEGAWVLFPNGDLSPPPALPPKRLIVPDGTWQQARKMVARLETLRRLPKLVLGGAPAGPRLRQPHLAEGQSTLEAIAAALAVCGEPGPAAELRALHQRVIARSERLRGPWHHYGR